MMNYVIPPEDPQFSPAVSKELNSKLFHTETALKTLHKLFKIPTIVTMKLYLLKTLKVSEPFPFLIVSTFILFCVIL